jgi:hypothetical protein
MLLSYQHSLMHRRTAARNAYLAGFCSAESLLFLIRQEDSRLDAAHRTHKGSADVDQPRQGAATLTFTGLRSMHDKARFTN